MLLHSLSILCFWYHCLEYIKLDTCAKFDDHLSNNNNVISPLPQMTDDSKKPMSNRAFILTCICVLHEREDFLFLVHGFVTCCDISWSKQNFLQLSFSALNSILGSYQPWSFLLPKSVLKAVDKHGDWKLDGLKTSSKCSVHTSFGTSVAWHLSSHGARKKQNPSRKFSSSFEKLVRYNAEYLESESLNIITLCHNKIKRRWAYAKLDTWAIIWN